MFDKIKQIKKARELQNALSQEKVEVEKKGVKVVMTGDMKVDSVSFSSDVEKEEQGELVKECVNEAMDKIKRLLAEKMSQMGGFGM